jgi:glycosyltransferase involved in cell wall biosynthesis
MKLLMIFQTSPYPPDLGPTKRNFPLFLENLKRHEVSVLAFGTQEEEKRFRETYGTRCKHIVFVNNKRPRALNFLLRLWLLATGRSSYRRFYTRSFERALQNLLQKERFDLIHCCTTILGYYRLPKNIPLVGDTHNVEYDNIYRAYKQSRNLILKAYFYWDYLRLKHEELEITKKFDVVVTTTDRDRQLYLRELPEKPMVVIPNGVEPAFFERLNVEEEPKTMVFTGLMSYLPNHHGITYFLDEIFPLILEREPEARIMVVGAFPPKKLLRRSSANVIVTGWVDDVRPYFARGQVFVIPLLIGGGIRGKALEAMAMRRPIVTTTLGCEGINLKHEESALFADTPREFADAVVRLFNDPALRARLAENAYRNVVEGYSWEVNGLAFERVYQSLIHGNDNEVKFRLDRVRASKPVNALDAC